MWSNPEEWARRRSVAGCVICAHNEPLNVIAEYDSCWVTAAPEAPLARPVKMNYEIHGNTIPHLHMHLFPRSATDPFVGGPIDPRRSSVTRSAEQLAVLAAAVARG